MAADVDAATLKAWLSDGSEIAVLDTREHGQYGRGICSSRPAAYSRFELGLPALVPNPAVRLVLCDDGDASRPGRRRAPRNLAIPRRMC